ncbi:NAD-dependent epimerase/dehydratase family protein [Streptomyces sp. NPDC086010]|uniref:NAD-dependent epimerase/dehydratase family protein n=1 Tax=Streptomyces sp. NPDC086010 TaxID=3365745 RepID=UPI0037CDBCFE
MFTDDLSALSASGKPVLVTGGTGYVGGHTVARLLREGIRTRVTVRESAQQTAVRAALGRAGVAAGDGLLEFFPAELTEDAGWADAMEGVGHVLHLASPFPFVQPDSEEELIRPARDGALRVLQAARAAAVPRVVMTSSYAAVGYTVKPDGHYSETDWTDPDTEGLPPYHKSKVLAERAAWDFVRDQDGIELAVINPTGIFGPVLSDRPSASVGLVRAMLAGQMPVVPVMHFGIVDVRDVVDLHLRAMLHPKAAGERFIGVSGPPSVSLYGMGQVLRERFPSLAGVLPHTELAIEQVREAAKTDPGLREAAGLKGQRPVISNEKATSMLGWQPREARETIVETAESLVRWGLVVPGGES